ncbi:elongin A, like [Aulostomus maculatus]
MRFKLQLMERPESATVLKILQKLQDLDITLDILAETGIGKTVNSLRTHEEAGDLAKLLVRGWKKLVPKKSSSHTVDGNASDTSLKDKLENLNNCFTSHEDSDSGDTNSEDAPQKPRPESKEKLESTSGCGGLRSERELNKKSKPFKKPPQESKEAFSFESRDKYSKRLLKVDVDPEDRSPGTLRSSEAQNRKRKKHEKEKHVKCKEESEYKEHSKPHKKKSKIKHEDKESDMEEPCMSFESYLNYDKNVPKKKERFGVKKPSKKVKTAEREKPTKDLVGKPVRSPVTSANALSPKKESVMAQLNVPLPAVLSELDKPSSFDYLEKKVEKESDLCDVSEEPAVFTGQRFNSKMQVYSGAKTVFLPAMMSLYQQCIRTLQNNINLLYETGGVPFEILEPVLERCTPEQLLRIEECNPVYIGVTDHLWGKHCQKDFKDAKLQEYESWKEMYIRLSEERERKFQRLTRSIVSAHSKKPKGRQVKMAFIHTVAKPPRDVRIQQEIHGTAAQQPQLRGSIKVQDARSRPSHEPARSSSTSSGLSSTQDPRKKTRVAPMMAKSLKAFKKQLGRR